MYTRLKGLIKRADAVRSQEQDASKVSAYVCHQLSSSLVTYKTDALQLTQEHSNHRVPVYVLERTLLQEDIGLVDEDDSFPCRSQGENSCELTIKDICRCTQFPSANDIQRLSDVCGYKAQC